MQGEAVVSVPGAVGEAEGGKKKKKKKKTRIDPNKLGLSNRVVFTDDGEAKTGLDLLGGSGEGEGKGEADEEALERIVERAGLDVGEFESAEERFRRAREILKERDARDRQAQVRGLAATFVRCRGRLGGCAARLGVTWRCCVALQRERLKEKRLKKKMKEKLEKEQEGVEVVLGGER